jgi:hypothetical protein
MHSGMSFAFVCAKLTRQDTGVQLSMDQLVRRFRLPHDQSRCRCANLRAVEINANAATKRADVARLAKAGVSARGTHLLAERQCIKDFCVVFRVLEIRFGMTAQHGFNHCDIHD